MIWLLVLGSGALSNPAFCARLLRNNRIWSNYRQPKVIRLYAFGTLRGLLWGGSIFAYGAAAPTLGKFGPAIGWPLSLVVSLVTANFCGFAAGEWKFSLLAARRWMTVGVAILLGSIGILGWSGRLAH